MALTLTMKIRQAMKWHNKPPVNGRSLEIEDILFSWERDATKGSDRGFLVNAASCHGTAAGWTDGLREGPSA